MDKKLFTTNFACDYKVCKAACCWAETTFVTGGELTEEEYKELVDKKDSLLHVVPDKFKGSYKRRPYLTENGKRYTNTRKSHCLFSCAKHKTCALKIAHTEGIISFDMPASCGMYPAEVFTRNRQTKIRMLHTWDAVCTPAFIKGDKERIPVFRFLKERIIKQFNIEFYNSLEDAYRHF